MTTSVLCTGKVFRDCWLGARNRKLGTVRFVLLSINSYFQNEQLVSVQYILYIIFYAFTLFEIFLSCFADKPKYSVNDVSNILIFVSVLE